MKVLIIGAGAVGLGLGSCLSSVGDLAFVTRAGKSDSLRGKPLIRTGVFGDVSIPADRITVFDGVAAFAGDADFILVCTQAFSAPAVAVELASNPAVGRTPIVLCHNGWGSADVFVEYFEPEQIYNARVITGFRCLSPHEVDITVHADAVHIGSLFDADLTVIEPLVAAIAAGGLPCETTGLIGKDLWAKLLYNCALNPLGALLGVSYGALAERETTKRVMQNVVEEVFQVMHAAGFDTHWPNPSEYLDAFYRDFLPPTAKHESSMLQDLQRGSPTEIDALCGAVVRLGEREGIETPVNRALRDLIRSAEAR